jgi:hypothetical protein
MVGVASGFGAQQRDVSFAALSQSTQNSVECRSGEIEQVCALGIIELQRPGEPVEDALGGVARREVRKSRISVRLSMTTTLRPVRVCWEVLSVPVLTGTPGTPPFPVVLMVHAGRVAGGGLFPDVLAWAGSPVW